LAGGGAGRPDAEQIEYAKMMGKEARRACQEWRLSHAGADGQTVWGHLSDPFYDNGPNDKGIGIQLAHSLGRVGWAFCWPAGGHSAGLRDRHVAAAAQGARPVHPGAEADQPLAWMPLALYTIKDSSISGIFVIFICSVWPMLINTAFGVASVKREWLNVAARWR
jgi:nitrate/nitrite transport system permease protein